MKKTIFAFLCIVSLVFVSFTAKANSTLNNDQDKLIKVNKFAQENLDKLKGKLNSEVTLSSMDSKSKKRAYELFGLKDIDEANKLEIGKIFRVYSLLSDNLNESDDLTNLMSSTDYYQVILNLNKKPKMKVFVTLDQNDNFKIIQYGQIGKQMTKALEKADENAEMFTTDSSNLYLFNKDSKKIIPAISFKNDADELSIKEFAQRNNEQRQASKKIAEKEEKEKLDHDKKVNNKN